MDHRLRDSILRSVETLAVLEELLNAREAFLFTVREDPYASASLEGAPFIAFQFGVCFDRYTILASPLNNCIGRLVASIDCRIKLPHSILLQSIRVAGMGPKEQLLAVGGGNLSGTDTLFMQPSCDGKKHTGQLGRQLKVLSHMLCILSSSNVTLPRGEVHDPLSSRSRKRQPCLRRTMRSGICGFVLRTLAPLAPLSARRLRVAVGAKQSSIGHSPRWTLLTVFLNE